MTEQSGDVAGARPTPWVLDHPGAAALVSSLVAIVGIVLVAGWYLSQGGPRPDLLDYLRGTMQLSAGALMFLYGLPAALGLAGASFVTGREVWGGVAGGSVSAVLTLALVVVVLPGGGLAL